MAAINAVACWSEILFIYPVYSTMTKLPSPKWRNYARQRFLRFGWSGWKRLEPRDALRSHAGHALRRNGSIGALRLMVEAGADLSRVSKSGTTAASMPKSRSHGNCVELLSQLSHPVAHAILEERR